jgi:hypothetical protein
MTKIYTDTNPLIDFYQAALDKIEVLDEITKHKATLVFTRQTINEFRRNRVATLIWLFAEFKKTVEVRNPYTTSILRSLPTHKELTSLLKEYKKKAAEVGDYLRRLIESEANDPIAQKLATLWSDAAVKIFETTDELVDKAFRRKLLGSPPTSPDKHTVGDELNWETLLENMTEDLIIVTRDRSFLHNEALLKAEFNFRTAKNLILITDAFSAALKAIGQTPSKKLLDAEEQFPDMPFKWVTKGSGKHAAILFDKINDLIWDYVNESDDDIGGDEYIIPIKRLVAARMLAYCDDIEATIREDYNIDSEEDQPGAE